MNQEVQMKEIPFKLDYSSEESVQTDHGDDPHIYGSKWAYIMSAVGVCVGFGSFWRFPYLVYKNGGGAFLIPYFIAMGLIGMPLLYLETSIGQMFRKSIPYAFAKIHPSLKVIGIGIMTATLHFATSYNIILSYCYRFLFTSFEYPLPYAAEGIDKNDYFHQQILHKSDRINNFEAIDPMLFLLYIGSMALCYFVIKNGAKTSGKIIIVTASTPFVIFFILVIRGLFLEGALEGIIFLFKPKWELLADYTIWIDATTQVFYQLTLGLGTMCNLSTAKPRRQDIWKSVFIVPLSLILCGLLSSLTIFIYLSHFCVGTEYTIDDPRLKLSGLELSFNVLPKALLLLPMANLWLFIFFFAMVLLGIDSEFGLMESIFCYVRDEFKHNTINICGIYIDSTKAKYLTLILMCIGYPFLASHAGIYYLQWIDYFMSNIPFTLWVMLELYFFVHVFSFDEMSAAILKYTKVPTPLYIKYCLKSYWLPALLCANLILAIYNQIFIWRKYTFWFGILGWVLTLYPVVYIYYRLRKEWPGWSQMRVTFKTLDNRASYF